MSPSSSAIGPLGVSALLWEVLACPVDQGNVVPNEDTGEIQCTTCAATYPILDGIPVMLPARLSTPGDDI